MIDQKTAVSYTAASLHADRRGCALEIDGSVSSMVLDATSQ